VSTPTPRPALKKAADAHIHPAAPGHAAHSLRHAAEVEAAAVTAAGTDPSGAPAHRLSGPLRGTTTDSLVTPGKGGRRGDRRSGGKPVELTVKVPKSLRKEFRAAAKARKQDPDEIVTVLLRAWLES
jgi:hypothetical protein